MRLVALLADGALHSGEDLSQILGVSRAAVWKQLKKLQDYGLYVDAERSRGYQLRQPLDLLDRDAICQHLETSAYSSYDDIHVFDAVESTNTVALELSEVSQTNSICLAEYQSAGRGRRGRTWVSPFGANLYLSFAWRYNAGVADLAGLSLAVGVAISEVLTAFGANDVQLKWPNDLYANGKKLGGVLIELQGEPNDEMVVVLGLGINVRMPEAGSIDIDQPWTDLTRIGCSIPSRSVLAAALISAVDEMWAQFVLQGFALFASRWRELDALQGQRVHVELGQEKIFGHASGVADDGAFLLTLDSGEVQRFYGGEVSLRPA